MLSKHHRLTTKEVNYILKKRQVISTPNLLFFWIPQYTNRNYNQFGIQLSTKLHKRSVKRNKLKRSYYNLIEELEYITTKTWKTQQFIKTIALPHKNDIEDRNNQLSKKQWDEVALKLKSSLSKLF